MTTEAADVRQARIGDLLGLGVQLEAGTERVYEEFARMFEHCPEVAGFWRVLAADEASHKSRLIEIGRGLSEERLSQGRLTCRPGL